MTQFAVSAPAADGWAIACSVPLMPIDPEVARRLAGPPGAGSRDALRSLRFPSDRGAPAVSADPGLPADLGLSADPALYDACREEALRLVADHLQSEQARRQPQTSGVLALRSRRHAGELVIDLAPAIEEPDWLARQIALDFAHLAEAEHEVTFGSEVISIGRRDVALPSARMRFADTTDPPEDLRMVLPGVWLPGAPEASVAPFPLS